MTDSIFTIFPKTILHSQLGRDFTTEELEFVKKQEIFCIQNIGNRLTQNKYILNSPEMYNIKNIISTKLKFYFREILCVNDNLDLYITQSWINYFTTGSYHHRHKHPNSFLSGTLYFHAENEIDKIMFIDSLSILSNNLDIFPQVKKQNLYNSTDWFFPAKTGEMFIFPSSLEHEVPVTTSKNTRISLSFNAFLKGNLGLYDEVTELTL